MHDYFPSILMALAIIVVAFVIGKIFISPVFETQTRNNCDTANDYAGVMGSAINNWCKENQ